MAVLVSLAIDPISGADSSARASSSHSAKVKVTNRVASKIMDLTLVVAMSAILPYPLGPFLGFAYSLLADGMNFGPFRGQSVGKKVMKLRVINQKRKTPATYRESVLRNAPVGVATFFAIIPVWGWLILILIGVPLMIMEIYLMARVETGHRLGDVMGDTEVVEDRDAPQEPTSYPG